MGWIPDPNKGILRKGLQPQAIFANFVTIR